MTEEVAFTLCLVTAYGLSKAGLVFAVVAWRNHVLDFDFSFDETFSRLARRFEGHRV